MGYSNQHASLVQTLLCRSLHSDAFQLLEAAYQHPNAQDILLIVEVSDTSLSWDSSVKAGLYAETGISEYWIIDVRGDSLIVHSELRNGVDETVTEKRRGETIRINQLPGFEFNVSEVLGENESR